MEQLSSYISMLVAAIICVTIIEMILPNGKLKKYIILMCGMFLIIVIINPVISLLGKDIDISKYLKENQIEIANQEYESIKKYSSEKEISKLYKENLRTDIIERLKERGYKVSDVEFEINSENYEPTQMILTIEGKDGYIQPVIIDANSKIEEKLTQIEKEEITTYISQVYEVSKNKIVIK